MKTISWRKTEHFCVSNASMECVCEIFELSQQQTPSTIQCSIYFFMLNETKIVLIPVIFTLIALRKNNFRKVNEYKIGLE